MASEIGSSKLSHCSPSRFEDSEYSTRWQNVQQACREQNLAGAVIWSRGGATVDAYADVYYLSNHYTMFPVNNDYYPYWSGRGHAAIILPADSEPTLVVDVPDWRRDQVAVQDVRFSLNLPDAVISVIRERQLARSPLALVAGNGMNAGPYRRLLETGADIDFVPADDLIERIRTVKSDAELGRVEDASAAGQLVMDAIMRAALIPGTTEAEAVAAGYAVAIKSNVAMYDAAVASGPLSHYFSFGKLPSWTTRTLESGDIFHVDLYGALNGYLFDFSRTCIVGGKATKPQLDLLHGAVAAVEQGISAIRPGVTASDVFETVHHVLTAKGLAGHEDADGEVSSAALDAAFPCHGHGFGLGWESPWFVPDETRAIEAGMCVAIEVMAGIPEIGSVMFEQDVIVTEQGTRLLTGGTPHFYAD